MLIVQSDLLDALLYIHLFYSITIFRLKIKGKPGKEKFMLENELQTENSVQAEAPEISENALSSSEQGFSQIQESTIEGQAQAPLEELILGKFKSVDDLSKAYQELEKLQGNQSAELGSLRQNAALINNINQAWQKESAIRMAEKELKEAAQKYNTPQYFQDPSFRKMYGEAYLALGKNLDVDRFVNLLEGYVSSRIFALEKSRAANAETQGVLSSMTFDKNNSSSITPPKKRLDEMTSKEVDELLERLI